jgi:hypothetical protein
MTQPVRDAIRYGIVLLGGFIAGSKLISAVQSLQQWRTGRESDPSAADLYLTSAEIDSAIAVISLALAVLLWWSLRPLPKR